MPWALFPLAQEALLRHFDMDLVEAAHDLGDQAQFAHQAEEWKKRRVTSQVSAIAGDGLTDRPALRA